VDDGPNDRMVCTIGNHDGKGRAETNPVFGALDAYAITFFGHSLTYVSEWNLLVRRSSPLHPASSPVACPIRPYLHGPLATFGTAQPQPDLGDEHFGRQGRHVNRSLVAALAIGHDLGHAEAALVRLNPPLIVRLIVRPT
jgi:hypothetical protein